MRQLLMVLILATLTWGNPEESLRFEPQLSYDIDCSMREIYLTLPQEVECIKQFLQKGKLYGRLRINTFVFDWKDELRQSDGSYQNRRNHSVVGVGGNLIYKSAYFNGFGLSIGTYFSRSFGSLSDSDVRFDKSGKDMLSRYDLLSSGKRYMLTFAQAYGEYRYASGYVKIGRQLVETLLLKSNDTKMIPNTFEGIFWRESALLQDTILKAGVFWKQKLRDHSTFHHVLAYGDDPADPYALYSQNDDSAMHRGLTLSALQARGIKDRLWVLEINHHHFKPFYLLFDVTSVPDLITTTTFQAHYAWEYAGYHIVPTLRYMRQFDNGAGNIGGANLRLNTVGYKSPNSLDAQMVALKVDIIDDFWKFRLSHSDIFDKGDFVAPWRGFPTGGFTRAMGQYNWYANTRTSMAQLDFDFDKAGITEGLKVISRYGLQDFDDTKPGVQADAHIFTFDLFWRPKYYERVKFRLRYGRVMGDSNTIAMDGTQKNDPSYQEARFEINYLF